MTIIGLNGQSTSIYEFDAGPVFYPVCKKKQAEMVIFGDKSKFMTMDIAVKKVELIEWLARLQDEKLIRQIETLRKGSINELYEQRMPKTKAELKAKLDRSENGVMEGKVHSQKEVESHFKARFKR